MHPAIPISLGLLFSSLPIWRSGEERGLNLYEFAYEHSTFSRQRQWIQLKDEHGTIWVELEEGRPKTKFLYSDNYKGSLVGHVIDKPNNNQFREVSDILGKVRGDGRYYSLKDFITPTEPLVRDLASTLYQGGNFIKDTQNFIHSQIRYKSERGDFWKFPTETLEGHGDCEDSSILLCSILRNYIPPEEVYVVAGDWKGDGHCWVIAGEPWNVIETTASSAKSIREDSYKPEAFFNDRFCWVSNKLEFDFITVGKRYYFQFC